MNGRSPLDRMKSRNFYMVVVLVILSTVSLWFLTSPTQSMQTLVSKTHTGIRNLPSNVHTKVDPQYLRRLGLISSNVGTSINAGSKDEAVSSSILPPTLPKGPPVIASAAKPDLFEESATLMRSVQSLLPEYKVVMFDLGLSTSSKILLNKYCNVSWSCEVRPFQFDKYPSHVKYLNIKSYRPICIQEMLFENGAVIWVDEGQYMIQKNLTTSLSRAKSSGIQAWPIKDPTSFFTHPNMFKYLDTKQESYRFQHAVKSSHLIIYNTQQVAKDIMLPWVKCALVEECINPPGAQNTGCNYYRKPYYLYSGCHKYDMSALNIILGKAFGSDENSYSANQTLFGSLAEDKLKAENRTQPTHEMKLGIGQQVSI